MLHLCRPYGSLYVRESIIETDIPMTKSGLISVASSDQFICIKTKATNICQRAHHSASDRDAQGFGRVPALSTGASWPMG
jgi:hypothetical protein